MIRIFSSKNAAVLRRSLAKISGAEVFSELPTISKLKAGGEVYLDISGLSQAELKKALGLLKKNTSFWGIIDPKGKAEDPALFFFQGASDYIGPAAVIKGLTKKRFNAALSHAAGKKEDASGRRAVKTGAGGQRAKASNINASKTNASKMSASNMKVSKANFPKVSDTVPKKKTVAKLSAAKFPGWKSIRAGATESFLFMFITLSGKSNLHSIVGDETFKAIKTRMREVLKNGFREADALLWMETEDSYLFLVPPRIVNGRAAVEAALKIILGSRLIGIEKLGLTIPLEFTMALHYGKTIFQTPGKTGMVISDSINYIFHLGTKKAETGRLTISDDVSEESIPEGLQDFFSPAGIFEGISIRHSRRFIRK